MDPSGVGRQIAPKRKETPGFVDFPTSTDGLGRYAGCEGAKIFKLRRFAS